MSEIVVLGHNDLDMLGCVLNIEYKLKEYNKKYFCTNYLDLDSKVNETIDFIEKNNCSHLFIVDVSFSDYKQLLDQLYSLDIKIIYIDHHQYGSDFWDSYPDMTVKYEKNKCAALLCNEFFKNAGHNERLDKLTRIIDVYDLWQTDEPEFDVSQDVNNYFWYKIKEENKTLFDMVKILQENDFKLPSDFIEIVDQIKQQYLADINNYEQRGLIQRTKDITLCFIPNWFNQIIVSEMNNGKTFVICINQYGIVRTRINKKSNLTDDQKNNIRLKVTGNVNSGHAEAFTHKYKEKLSFENSINEAQRIIKIINETLMKP